MLAAERLRGRGLDAVSLEGGMRAWSLAWNTGEVPCPGSTARIVQLRRTGKGCLSYLIGSNGAAAVVDASLEPQIYRRVADERGWPIRTVLETHVHADHLSRARTLAVEAGARLCLPTTDRVSFEYAPLKDGDTVRVGSAGLRVLHTPGHTRRASAICGRAGPVPGDTLFLAAVGRPDLEATTEQSRRRAHVLRASLQRLLALPPETVSCLLIRARPWRSTVGHQRDARGSPGATSLLRETEETFVQQILTRLPPTPPNHHRIVALNEAGTLPDDPTELEAGANRCAVA